MRQIPEVNDVQIAFGNTKHMPKFEDVPEDFKVRTNKWNVLFNEIFYKGGGNVELMPKDAVDPKKAIRAIRAIMVSMEPKHEHKEAACAYLLSEWFEDYQIRLNDSKEK